MNATSATMPRLAAIVGVGLLLSLFFFAPRLWLFRHETPGSFQWDRGLSYLKQCEHPLRRDVEPAMVWRVLPPLACHALGLRGRAPFILPWLGVLVATSYVAALCRRRVDDWRFVAGCTFLFASTSAVLVATSWLGVNDAWVWLGLLVVAFGRNRWLFGLACLLCPWIDERFVIGFPVAWLVRQLESSDAWSWSQWQLAAGLVPWALLRFWLGHIDSESSTTTAHFASKVIAEAPIRVPLAPLGWWMGLRLAWIPVAYAIWRVRPWSAAALASGIAGTAIVLLLLASDISRSIAFVVPATLLGCFMFARHHPNHAPRAILALGLANFIVPAAHIVLTHVDPINPLPIELMRLFRIA